MFRIAICTIIFLAATVFQREVDATTYNCFDVDKRASLGIDGGVVAVNGDQSQKTCKFSVDNATVDGTSGGGSGLNALLERPQELQKLKDGGLEQFRTAMLSPFADTTSEAVEQEFNAYFGPNANEVANCLSDFVDGAAPQLGLNSIICQTFKGGQDFEFHGLHGTASELMLVIGASLEKSNHVLILAIPQGLAKAVAAGQFRFR